MNAKLNLGLYFWIWFVVLSGACGIIPSESTTPISATFTPVSQSAAILASTETPLPTLPLPTQWPAATSLPMPLPKFPLDGYVVLFTKDEYLYFQNGNNSPVELGLVGEVPFSYILSDDSQRVAVIDPDPYAYENQGFTIGTDGAQKKPILPGGWPNKNLSWGTRLGKVDFVPGTHQLLVETVLCESQEFRSPCSASIFLADTDTGDIKKLADLGLAFQQNSSSRNVMVSPDGMMVAVGAMDGMDILTMDGKVIRHGILPYTPGTSSVLFPSLFWLPDSTGLLVALPDTFYDSPAFGPEYPGHTLWRYTIADNDAIQIQLDSPIPGSGSNSFDISSDGNWIVYGGISPNNNDADSGVYIGDFANGQARKFGNAYVFDFSWSPGSKYFIATSTGSVLGGIDVPAFISGCPGGAEWIDARHFTCWMSEGNVLRLRMAEIDAEAVRFYDFGFERDVESSIFIRPQ